MGKKFRKSDNEEVMELWKPFLTAHDAVNWCNPLEISLALFNILPRNITSRPIPPILLICALSNTRMFITALFVITTTPFQPKYPSTGQMNYFVVYSYNWMLFSNDCALTHAGMWMNLTDPMLDERTQWNAYIYINFKNGRQDFLG